MTTRTGDGDVADLLEDRPRHKGLAGTIVGHAVRRATRCDGEQRGDERARHSLPYVDSPHADETFAPTAACS